MSCLEGRSAPDRVEVHECRRMGNQMSEKMLKRRLVVLTFCKLVGLLADWRIAHQTPVGLNDAQIRIGRDSYFADVLNR